MQWLCEEVCADVCADVCAQVCAAGACSRCAVMATTSPSHLFTRGHCPQWSGFAAAYTANTRAIRSTWSRTATDTVVLDVVVVMAEAADALFGGDGDGGVNE